MRADRPSPGPPLEPSKNVAVSTNKGCVRTAGARCRVSFAAEYRQNAYDCLSRAREAGSLNDQGYWAGMAQLWLQLAQHAEDYDAGTDPLMADLPRGDDVHSDGPDPG